MLDMFDITRIDYYVYLCTCFSMNSTAETFQQKRRRYRTNSESFNMKNRLQLSKTIGGSAMKRNVSTPGFSRLPTSIELTRLDSTTNDQDKEIGGLEERRLSSFFFEVQVSPN